MSVTGEGRAPGRTHLLQLAGPAGLSSRKAESILDRVASAASRWRGHAREAGASAKTVKRIEKVIEAGALLE